MSERMDSAYPGGPTRAGTSLERPHRRPISLAEIRERELRAALRGRRRARLKTIILSASLLAIIGGAIGVAVGARNLEPVDVMKEADENRMFDEQINRVLSELWKMEELELPRSRR